jgi:hypothetical protein
MGNHTNKKYLIGVFNDEEIILNACKQVRAAGVKIHDVYSPFPIHGIDPVIGIKNTRLHIVAFLFGLTGFLLAVTMQVYMMTIDWNNNIGGKPYLPIPSFVPVSFELTVLLTSLGMVGTFLVISNLYPQTDFKPIDVRITDDKFIVAIEVTEKTKSFDEISRILKDNGAEEITERGEL